MTIAYLNGDYVPLEEAKISPMDRGFYLATAFMRSSPPMVVKP